MTDTPATIFGKRHRKYKWLRTCYDNWTTSTVESGAWRFRGDFEGFCRWFLQGEAQP